LEGKLLVEKVMPKARERLVAATVDTPIRNVAILMSEPHTDLVVISDAAGFMVGVVTKTDLVRYLPECCDGGLASVDTILTRDVFSCQPSDVLRDIWSEMNKRDLQRIPVVDGNRKPIGIVYSRDALQSLLSEADDEGELLREYIGNVGYR
jgi:CBS domain-containing protein